MTGSGKGRCLFQPCIVSTDTAPFQCGNGIPVTPDVSFATAPAADIVLLLDICVRPQDSIKGRFDELATWLRLAYQHSASIYAACSGSIMLAESGLLDGHEATSHWGYEGLFREQYPKVRFRPEPNFCVADSEGRIVTAGGWSSWHDLVLHVISRHGSPAKRCGSPRSF